jgi:predicted ATPase
MLTHVHIEHFRSCLRVAFDCERPVIALIGRNAAGKSNILQAISSGARAAVASEIAGVAQIDFPLRLVLEFHLGATSYKYELRFIVDPHRMKRGKGEPRFPIAEQLTYTKKGKSENVFKRDGSLVHGLGGREALTINDQSSSLAAIAAFLPANDPLVEKTKEVRKFLASIRYYPMNEMIGENGTQRKFEIILDEDYREWQKRYRSTGDAGDSVLERIIQMHGERKEDFDAFKALIGSNGLGVVQDVKVISHPGPVSQYWVRFHPDPRKGPADGLSYGELSLGTRRVVRAVACTLFDSSSVMLFDQLEDGLHAGLVRKLIGLLRQNASDAQIILASHSSALLNTLNATEIRLVSKVNGETAVEKLGKAELRVAAKFMNEEGPLSDFLEIVQEG